MPFSRLLSFFFVLGCFALPGVAHAAAEIRIAYQPSPLYAPLFVAKENKWVEEELAKAKVEGVKVVWASFAAGPAINESFAAEQQDVGFLGDSPALIGKSVGIDTKVIGLSVSGPKGLALMAMPKTSFSKPEELKGKKIAVTKGSFGQHFLALYLEKGALTFADIDLINMSPADIPPALLAGTVDAGVVWEPFITRYESEKMLRIVADGTGLKKGVQPIVASANAVKNKRAALEAVLRAYARGADFIRSNPKDAAALASKESNLSPALLEKVFAKQDFAPALTGDDVAEFKKAESYMRKLGLLKNAVDVEVWVDRSFVPTRGQK